MSHIIIEVWDAIKPFIPKKDRLDVSDRLASTFDEHGQLDGIEMETGIDTHLSAALASYVDLYDGEDDEDDEDNDW